MSNSGRSQRVAELIREEVGRLITKGLKDPRVGFVSVMSVRMSPDLHYANVYVSLYGAEREKKSSLAGLRNSEKWFRHEVGKHLRMRVIPEIRFFEDDTLDRVYHLEQVFEKIHAEQAHAPMIRRTLGEVVEELREGTSFLVTSHVQPDGDAIGSMLAMAEFLRALGKTRVACALAEPVPRIYKRLPGAKGILGPDSKRPEVDTVVIVDVSTRERVGTIREWIAPHHKVVILDHHLNERPEGAVGFIDHGYAATGEIVCDLFEAAGLPMTMDAAFNACVAQVTDTGGYRFMNTNARSHRIAARFHEAGTDVGGIIREFYETISVPKVKLLRLYLDRMEFCAGGRVAYSWIDAADIQRANGEREDMSGLVNYARNVEGVVVGAIFSMLEPGVTKVSLRAAPEFNAAAFLSRFGGGGHAAAAGATISRDIKEAMRMVLEALEDALGQEAEA